MIINVATWTLLTVMYGGNVSYSPGFHTQTECLEAKSLVLNGRTLAQQKKHDDEEAMAAKAWSVAHPCNPESTFCFGGYTTAGTVISGNTPRVSECIPVEVKP